MSHAQVGILAPLPPMARFVTFQVLPDGDPRESLKALSKQVADESRVIGLGRSLVLALGADVDGLRDFPAMSGPGFDVPSTQAALWIWLRGNDRGDLVHATRRIEQALEDAFELDGIVDCFMHQGGKDLTGYVDGTENPTGGKAEDAALLSGSAPGLEGSSFVATQQWVHDLSIFDEMSTAEQDHVIGRRKTDDVELDDAPPSAHVKRTAQESFDPEAWLVRRSMPWADDDGEGLFFVAFGRSFDAFDAQLRRMVGADDDVVDALFEFTRPVTGAYYWCPPVHNARLDLRAVGIV